MQARFDSILSGLDPGGKFLLAVSGGVDSMCMASLFLNSSCKVGFAVAHCNFHLRGEDSDLDEKLVEDWCSSHGIAFHKADFDTVEYSRSRGVSIEMAARELRYEWFGDLSRDNGYSLVAVAHNADDNAETLFLNLLRGTGLRGLIGMERVSGGIFRPLLGFSRQDILEYATSTGLVWREDRTNAESMCKRNILRNEVFPLLKKVNPSFLSVITGDMNRFRQDHKAARAFFDLESSRVMKRPKEGELVRIDSEALGKSPAAEYVLFHILEPYGFNPSVTRSLLDAVSSGGLRSGMVYYSDSARVITSSDSIIVCPLSGNGDEFVLVNGDGEYSLDGVSFSVRTVDWDMETPVKQPDGTVAMDASVLTFPFVVRHWREGDWMCPLGVRNAAGRRGRKKMSDIFVDLKYSLNDKEKALVVELPSARPGRIASLLWKRVDEDARLNEKTASAVLIVRKP